MCIRDSIETAQSESGWYFSGAETPKEGKGSWEVEKEGRDQELRLLESVCVQHEIDHLDGITMFDREFKQEPIVKGVNAPKKIGRNEKVTITKGTESKVLKYKKVQPMLEDGWTLSI